MTIIYFNTLYKRASSLKVFGDISFIDGCVIFSSGGHRYAIEYNHVISINKD